MVHSDRAVVVLLHKHFNSECSTFCNSVSIIRNRTYATVSEYNIQAYADNLFTFSSLLTTSNFSSYWLSSPILGMDCFGWSRFTFLTNFGIKRQSYWLYYHCNHSCALKWNRLKKIA